MITDELVALVSRALDKAKADGVVAGDGVDITFERPRRAEHGDWATSVALSLGRGGGDPRAIAEALVERMPPSDLVDAIEVAGPGFLNFRLSPTWLHDVIRRASDPSSGFGRSPRTGLKINVEYVSANPTGPINVVSGRHAAVGDSIANLLDAAGHDVTREFYINDAGRQAVLFGESIAARYLQAFGKEAAVPEGGYQGDYVKDIADRISTEIGDSLVNAPSAELNGEMQRRGLELMLGEMKASLERFGTHHDVWFSERTLHEKAEVPEAIERLRAAGYTYEAEGALWFKSSDLGDDKDRVLVRANDEPTYLAADSAYLLDKFGRGFDRLIYLWGADHHGAVARLKAVATALGFDPETVEVPIVQIVTLSSGEETLKGSKRAGVIVKLDDLVDEVGADAARYTFLTRSIEAHLDFDVAAVKEQAPENPVYYVQYAHARICSIIAKASEAGHATDIADASLDLLSHPNEDQLMRKIASYEEEIPMAAERRAPQRITRFLEELAADFSAFYRDCRVISDDAALTHARLALCVATKSVIADGLGLLGVSAPERM
ncbi:MAG TPA: arginine--tRNA ligase [Actinomycetota bacterium]|nr:arginine--tRNA ligase [Actinomycetota bacterium]